MLQLTVLLQKKKKARQGHMRTPGPNERGPIKLKLLRETTSVSFSPSCGVDVAICLVDQLHD